VTYYIYRSLFRRFPSPTRLYLRLPRWCAFLLIMSCVLCFGVLTVHSNPTETYLAPTITKKERVQCSSPNKGMVAMPVVGSRVVRAVPKFTTYPYPSYILCLSFSLSLFPCLFSENTGNKTKITPASPHCLYAIPRCDTSTHPSLLTSVLSVYVVWSVFSVRVSSKSLSS